MRTCCECEVKFDNKCPVQYARESWIDSPVDPITHKYGKPLYCCPSCNVNFYRRPLYDQVVLSSPVCEACPSYIKCMTLEVV